MSKADKALATKDEKTTALAVVDFEADAGAGFEHADLDSFAVPFLAILQKGSPQVDKDAGEYLKGAEAGMLFNTVTNELFDVRSETGHPVTVVPCAFKRDYIAWKLREKGGGFAALYSVAEAQELLRRTVKDEKNRDVIPGTDTHLVDARQHYVLLLRPGKSPLPMVISMSSTQLKKSRRWMTTMDNIKFKRTSDGTEYTPPMFSHIYALSTVPEQNEKGSWRGWKIEVASVLKDPVVYALAKQFRDKVSAGKVEVAAPVADTGGDM